LKARPCRVSSRAAVASTVQPITPSCADVPLGAYACCTAPILKSPSTSAVLQECADCWGSSSPTRPRQANINGMSNSRENACSLKQTRLSQTRDERGCVATSHMTLWMWGSVCSSLTCFKLLPVEGWASQSTWHAEVRLGARHRPCQRQGRQRCGCGNINSLQ
jgi:hypothetical protein